MADGEPFKSKKDRPTKVTPKKKSVNYSDHWPPQRSGIYVPQSGCAICHEKYSVGSILRPLFQAHVNAVGDTTYKGRYKGRSIELHVCIPCYDEQSNLIFKAVEEYHLEGDY